MSIIFYDGRDIYFRPLELEDEPLLRRWANDPRVWSTLNHRGPINGVKERRWIEQSPGGEQPSYLFGIVRKADDTLVGTCSLRPTNTPTHQAEFGIVIGEVSAQNHGLGSQATELTLRYGFDELNLHRIELSVLANNPRAIRVYERAGYRLEGRQVQATFRHGAYHDVLRYAILRSEWIARREGREASQSVTTDVAATADARLQSALHTAQPVGASR